MDAGGQGAHAHVLPYRGGGLGTHQTYPRMHRHDQRHHHRKMQIRFKAGKDCVFRFFSTFLLYHTVTVLNCYLKLLSTLEAIFAVT